MELALLIGLPGLGKSTLCREIFFGTHVRLSLDVLGTRHRESVLFEACLRAQARVVIDNTNASREERAAFIGPALAAGFRVLGYYIQTDLALALERNRAREGASRIPDVGVLAAHARLRLPQRDEGFDDLFFVRPDGRGGFTIEPWRDEPEQALRGAFEGESIYKDGKR